AVLGLVIADYLFKRFPYKEEGFLTEMRAKIVCRNSLNKLSEAIGLHKYILADKDSNNNSKFLKGDVFEAVIGAIYLDKGYNFTKKIIINKIIHEYININELVNTENNYKSKLIEYAQKEKKQLEFVVTNIIGSGINKKYIVDVIMEGVTIGSGQDFSIKGAEQNAAAEAMLKIKI
ncbi:MAG TPA: ribonuclease III domain-containing protein, partial [Bacteroidales bacterium]|nr:ribonuclease III domain-containing protein [Bacteroidales bacterium]